MTLFILLSSSASLYAQEPARLEPRSPESRTDEGAASRPGYKEAVAEGLDEFDRGNYVEARANFLEAHRIWPNARTLRVLGYCEFELKNYPAAIKLLEQALSSPVRALNEQMRRDVQGLLDRAHGYVAPITVLTMPPDAQVLIDGVDALLDAEHATQLAVGAHQLDVRAPKFYPAHRELQVESRVAQTLQIDLAAVREPAPADLPRSDAQPLRKKWWLWTTVGTVAAAALITGLAVGLHDPGQRGTYGGSERKTLTVGAH